MLIQDMIDDMRIPVSSVNIYHIMRNMHRITTDASSIFIFYTNGFLTLYLFHYLSACFIHTSSFLSREMSQYAKENMKLNYLY